MYNRIPIAAISNFFAASAQSKNVDNKSRYIPIVSVSIGNFKASALLDTGSTLNFISENMADYLILHRLATCKKCEQYARVANGQITRANKSVTLVIKIRNKTWKLIFFALKSLSYPVIIGSQSLNNMQAVLNCADNSVSFKFDPDVSIPYLSLPVSVPVDLLVPIIAVDPESDNFSEICAEFPDVLTERLGQAKDYKYTVQLTDDVPVRRSPYPLSPPQAQVMRTHIEELLEKGVISKAKSPYAAPAFLVKKPNGDFRLCIDYRHLNKKVRMDAFPVPAIEHIFQCLKGAKVFTTLDLNSAFYQIELSDKSKELTSFVTPEGQFVFHKTPFGLSVSPSSLIRLMSELFSDLRYKNVIVFFDDLLIYSENMDSHMSHVREVLQRLRNANLTVNPNKVKFAKSELKFLGHRISSAGLAVDNEKVQAIADLPVPKNLKQMMTFIGMVSYYAKFIPDYAQVVAPLNDLRKKGTKYCILDEHRQAIRVLKDALCKSPILKFPDFEREFILQTDASQTHLGSVLLQRFEDGLHPIAYASRRLTSAERKYSTYEQEALACIWSMEKFKAYLLHQKFILQTDSSCLTWLIRHPRNLGRVGRWLLRISRFQFDVEHIRGTVNCTADCLSRLFSESEPLDADPEVNELVCPVVDVNNQFNELKDMQNKSEELNSIKRQIEQGVNVRHFAVRDNFLVRLVGRHRKARIIVPPAAKPSILEQFHNSEIGAHPGVNKTYRSIARRFWWPKMFIEIRQHIKDCQLCLRHKSDQRPDKVMMSSSPPTAVWDRLYIDLMGPLLTSCSGNKYVLLILDGFSKWLITFAIPDSSSASIVKCLHQVFTMYGPPSSMVSDNATPFKSKKFVEFCNSWGTRPINSSPYHPASNAVERVIRNVRAALSILLQQKFQDHLNWDLLLNHITLCNNSTYHTSIKDLPCRVFLGREIKFPLDLKWNLPAVWESIDPPSSEFVRDVLKQSLDRQAQYYNVNRSPESKFQVGDSVVQKLHYQTMKPKFQLKLLPRYSEPRTIVRFTSPVSVELVDPVSGQLFKAHVEHIKKV